MEEHQSRHQLVHGYTQQEQHSLHPIRYHILLPIHHQLHTWQSPRISSAACTRLTIWHQDHQTLPQIAPLLWRQTMDKKLINYLFDVTMGNFDGA